MLAKSYEKQKLNFSCSALFHMKTRVSLKYFVNDCGFFKKENKRACCILIFFSTELLFKTKLEIHNMILILKANKVFLILFL